MNRQCYIPICYFPSTVLFVDDSKDFLVNFSLQLPENLTYKLYDSPYDALETIHLADLEKSAVTEPRECVLSQFGIPLLPGHDLSAMHQEIFNPSRFSELSVVVVDYAMPGLDGLHLCERIKNNQVKKILLTGKADEKTVAEAQLNELIDRCFFKSESGLYDKISNAISELQYEYFLTTSNLMNALLKLDGVRNIFDRQFALEFHDICRAHNISEYYLLDDSGSFLMLDENGHCKLLLLRDEATLKAQYPNESILKIHADQTYTFCLIDHNNNAFKERLTTYSQFMQLHDDTVAFA